MQTRCIERARLVSKARFSRFSHPDYGDAIFTRRRSAEAMASVSGSGDGGRDCGGGGDIGGGEGVGCEVRMATARWLGVRQQQLWWW
uniref:Uncharacterized protein n=1 Tax=Oryza rufipogon TaxID=4529 RepID=A0A0E0MWL6_ORYRU